VGRGLVEEALWPLCDTGLSARSWTRELNTAVVWPLAKAKVKAEDLELEIMTILEMRIWK
jgi:hypothetical protein